jgi:type II secretory pathway component GspD/PulD (secretin)
VVFGGVTVSSRSRSATYVPLIGSIPILGRLFKQSNLQDSDNELLFFVSPKVLEG